MAKVLLGLDHGSQRIGVAVFGGEYSEPSAYGVVENSKNLNTTMASLIKQLKPTKLIVGLPRNLDGEETAQSKLCREFAKSLEKYKKPVILQDETLSSERAASRLGPLTLKAKHKKLDAMAAQIILEDYIRYAAK